MKPIALLIFLVLVYSVYFYYLTEQFLLLGESSYPEVFFQNIYLKQF